MFPPSRHPIPYTTAAVRHGCCEGRERQHGAPGPKPDGRNPRITSGGLGRTRANSDAPGRPRMTPGELGRPRLAKEPRSSMRKRPALHSRSGEPARPDSTGHPSRKRPPGRRTQDHGGVRPVTPAPCGQLQGNGPVTELPHREPLRNRSDGAAVTPAVTQPPARPRRQGTQGNPEMLLTTARRQLPAWPVQHRRKTSWHGRCRPGDRKTPKLSAGRNHVPTPRQPRPARPGHRAGHGNDPRG